VLRSVVGADLEDLKATLLTTSQSFGLEVKTKDEMLTWVRTNTDLEEVETGKFLIALAEADFATEDRYLIID